MTLILGFETSCDETAAAVVEDGRRVRSNVIASQHDLHEKYGGVVPEIASRAHLQRITPVLDEALREAGVTLDEIDAVAVGNRPGLIGSLLVGVSAAKAVAWSLGRPLIGVDHIRAHLYAATMGGSEGGKGRGGKGAMSSRGPGDNVAPSTPHPLHPSLGLVISGGHTSLYAVESPVEMTLLGKTIDDAVGEAYDKAAVILDLGYPGGPSIDKAAQRGDPAGIDLPRSLLGDDSLDFSFSGLKTALLYAVRGHPVGRGRSARFERTAADLSEQQRFNLAAAFQQAAIETLIVKLRRGVEHMTQRGQHPRAILVGGGVSANSLLRRRVVELGAELGVHVGIPPMSLCLDNAAMIAGLAFEYFRAGQFDALNLQAVATTAM